MNATTLARAPSPRPSIRDLHPAARFAMLAAELGWAVLPLHRPRRTGVGPACSCSKASACERSGKHPLSALVRRGVKDATCELDTVRRWISDRPSANFGVALGRASGGIVCLDVDPRNGGDRTLADLVASYGQLPPTFAVRTGGGGLHFYFIEPDATSWSTMRPSGTGIELLGDGALVVAPGSLHASGKTYDVITSEPVAPIPGWLRPALGLLAERHRQPPTNPDTDGSPHPTRIRVREGPATAVDLEADVRRLVLTGPGQHDGGVLRVVRMLKVNHGLAWAEALPWVDRWHEWSQRHTAHALGDTLAKARRAWDVARLPVGACSVAGALKRSDHMPLPDGVADRFKRPAARRACGLLAELQRTRGTRPFALSCRQLGEALGTTDQSAHEMLQRLIAAGALKRTQRGTRGVGPTGVASMYRWLGVPAGESPTSTNRKG